MSSNPLVSVHMATYNHEPFIAQAIEGVLNQKTDFDFELIIGEDCSTDRTRAIVFEYEKKYTAIIKVITSDENVGPLLNWRRVYDACRGKYLAHCEGDDFWQDEFKLQKQVNFLEAHTDYGIIHSDLDQLYQKKNKLIKNFNKKKNYNIPEGEIFNEILDPDHYIIKTVTAVIRKNLLDKYFDINIALSKGWRLLDLPVWLELSNHCKIGYLNKSTATYRVLEDSLSNIKSPRQRLEFHKMVYDIRYYYSNKYGCTREIKRILDIQYNKAMLADAYLLKDISLVHKSINELNKLGCKLTLKENVLTIGLKNKFVSFFIQKYINY